MQSQQSYIDNKKIYDEELFKIQREEFANSIFHQSIVAIAFLTQNRQPASGSGLLISNNIILTSAHNIYDKKLKGLFTHFKVYTRANGKISKYYEIQDFRYPSQFESCENNNRLQHDYALIKLKENVENEVFPELSHPCQICLFQNNQSCTLQIYGYPGYKQNFQALDKHGSEITLHQYGLSRKNRIVNVNYEKHRIEYAITTLQGQSGCPIIVDNEVVGIHNGAAVNDQYNIGRLLTKDLIQNISRWAQELKSANLNIKQSKRCLHRGNKRDESQITMNIQEKRFLEKANAYQKFGMKFFKEQNYASALNFFERSIDIKVKINLRKKDSINLVKTLKIVGKIHEKSKDYDKALKYFYLALSLQEKLQNILGTAKILNSIGLIYYAQDSYKKAIQTFKMSIKIYELEKALKDIGAASTINNLGMVYEREKKYEAALEKYYQSFQIKQEILGKESIETASTLNNIGIIYKNLKQYSKAIDFYSKAIRICEKHQVENQYYAEYLYNLGCASFNTKQFQMAKKSFEDSSSTFQKLKIEQRQKAAEKLVAKCERAILQTSVWSELEQKSIQGK